MTEKTGVIFLQKDKFDVFQPLIGKVSEFRFVPEIIRDLEVVNQELLENLIKLFITNNKIDPSEMIIVLSDNVSFLKDFFVHPAEKKTDVNPGTGASLGKIEQIAPKVTDEEINFFIEHIPFERVISKTFPLENGVKVFAANQDLFESLKTSFEKLGFKITMVLPGIIFPNNVGSRVGLDANTAIGILSTAELLKEHNLLTGQKPVINQPKPEFKKAEDPFTPSDASQSAKKPQKKSNKRLFIMLAVFIILIIILIFVYLGSLQQPPIK